MNVKVSGLESKIPSITGLATNPALTTVENKIPNVGSLVNKTDYNANILDMEKKVNDHDHDEDITTSEFNNLTAKNFTARLAQANLVTKTDFDDKLKSLNKKINSNKTKYLLVKNELKKLQKFDSSYFRGKNYFGDDGTQNYFVFQPTQKYFKTTGDTNDNFSLWKSKGLCDESIISPSKSNNILAPLISYVDFTTTRKKIKLNGSCLRQDKAAFINGAMVNLYMVYEITKANL